MQHPQLHAGRSLKRTNKRMQKKNKKKLAHVLMGTSQPDFFFFFVISGTHQSTQDEQYSG